MVKVHPVQTFLIMVKVRLSLGDPPWTPRATGIPRTSGISRSNHLSPSRRPSANSASLHSLAMISDFFASPRLSTSANSITGTSPITMPDGQDTIVPQQHGGDGAEDPQQRTPLEASLR